MTNPAWTVVLLTVVWLIVVVPMVLRRRDERAGQRSVTRFRASMRALARRGVVDSDRAVDPGTADLGELQYDDRPTVHVNGAGHGAVTRRPVPASEESLMYAPDQHEMSSARRQMMARRRRSLTILAAGSVLFLLLAVVTGSSLAWTPAVLFVLGLIGYLLFLRSQARRDRERRQARRQRQSGRSSRDYDATEHAVSEYGGGQYADAGHHGRVGHDGRNGHDGRERRDGRRGHEDETETTTRIRRVASMDSVVRIDEDDVSLDHLDTVDLTGLYSEVEFEERTVRRAG